MITSQQPWKATVSACEKLQLTTWLDSDTCRWAWQAVDGRTLQLWVCVSSQPGMLKRESVCQKPDMAVCECVKPRGEFMRWQLVSCLTFPVSQGSSFKNNAEQKTHQTLTIVMAEKKNKKASVCWWLNYCRCLILETGNVWEWLHCACTRHISPTGLIHPSISQHCSQ